MSSPPQAQKPRPLDRKQVRIALASRDWTQAYLAQLVGKSLTTVNLTINHNTYPAVADKIRAVLSIK